MLKIILSDRSEKTLKQLDLERRALRAEFAAFREHLSELQSNASTTKEQLDACLVTLADLWQRLDENEELLIAEYQAGW